MQEFKSGFVSIIGRTNVGKSTLMNALAKEKVSIITRKVQTTRTAIKAIVNREHSQIVFIDTPGIHKPKNKLGKIMVETATDSLTDVDVILFVVEANAKAEIGKGDRFLLEKLKEKKRNVILIINKIDKIKKEVLAKMIETYRVEYDFKAVIPTIALKEKGIEDILIEIEKYLPIGPAYYSEDEYTDQTERQLAEEVIREKALKLLEQEVPHGLYVEIEKLKQRKTTKGEQIYDIEAVIYCLKKSHKGIIIGKNGSMLKRIGQYARQDLEEMFGIKVNLQLWVKVKEDWIENDQIVNKFNTLSSKKSRK